MSMNPGWVRCMDVANAQAARKGRRQVVRPRSRRERPVVMWLTHPVGEPEGFCTYQWPADRRFGDARQVAVGTWLT